MENLGSNTRRSLDHLLGLLLLYSLVGNFKVVSHLGIYGFVNLLLKQIEMFFNILLYLRDSV